MDAIDWVSAVQPFARANQIGNAGETSVFAAISRASSPIALEVSAAMARGRESARMHSDLIGGKNIAFLWQSENIAAVASSGLRSIFDEQRNIAAHPFMHDDFY
ncbi:hypothetical protein HGP17_29110 [Rhizobium sp. P38BS-XIX]|uniref:hypothetical protein n=1 Tax=Rhizobium sp. P38BS-XIX TaxID=2726740 RepID=UPI00145707DD|nr:hypothetical protein [Rhizobium sp. P38BS-XIX]NLS00909.1 hypothetical protein [Rhizobium sp. P38BS-XIX]